MSEDREDASRTRSGRSFGVGRPGDNESFNDSHVGPSELAAPLETIPAEEDGSPQSSRESDSTGQDVETQSPTHAELPVVGAGSYNTRISVLKIA